jgi:hypothetical protein
VFPRHAFELAEFTHALAPVKGVCGECRVLKFTIVFDVAAVYP